MNKAISLKNVTWMSNGLVAAFTSSTAGFGIVNAKGQLLSSNGVSPAAFLRKSHAQEQAPYADGFTDHSWVTPVSGTTLPENTDNLTQLVNVEGKFSAEHKAAFHLEARRVLTILAKRMGLEDDEFKFGVYQDDHGMSGHVSFHTESMFMIISRGAWGSTTKQMYRRCNGLNNASGGMNRWVDVFRLLDDDTVEEFTRIHETAMTA